MDIELPCEKCGHPMRFPREQAGRMGKCPRCGNDVYIPTPEEELEELPLSPEDRTEEMRERQLLEERRRIDRILAGEAEADESAGGPGPSPAARPHPAQSPAGAGRTTVRGVVMTFLAAMRDSDLKRADQAAALLTTRRDEVLKLLDQLAGDQLPPPEMANVPPGVYQGFLKALRARM